MEQLNFLDIDQPDDQFENEDDSELSSPGLMDGVVVTDSDWTTETILSQLSKGNIQLNPRFQRREAWDDKRKSKFIESLLMGLPIPQLVLAEQKDQRGKYLVIDGKQRLLTLIKFAGTGEGKNLSLSGLEIRSDLNGKTWEDIKSQYPDDVSAFENMPIRTTTIRGWKDERALYLIFHRLNSGSVSLSPQELRHTLHPGSFIDFAFDFTEKSLSYISILGRKGKPDFRMRDVELLIRFIGLKTRLSHYKGDLKKFLDSTVSDFNKSWQSDGERINELARQSEIAIEFTREIFDQNTAFTKWTEKGPERRFNRAVFDVMTFYFSDQSTRDAIAKLKDKKIIQYEFSKLCIEVPEFIKSVESTTKTLDAVLTRLLIWGKTLNKILQREIVGFELVSGLAEKNGIR